jgi:hypothetical protein
MSEMQKAVLATVAIALVFTAGCYRYAQKAPPPGHHYGQKDSREFEVYIYADPNNPSQCLLDWPVGTLWKNKHQTVTWFSDDGNQYTVDFTQGSHAPDKSPFQTDTFSVSASSYKKSGSLQPNANGYYDFAVLDSHGNKCKDTSDPGYYVK